MYVHMFSYIFFYIIYVISDTIKYIVLMILGDTSNIKVIRFAISSSENGF